MEGIRNSAKSISAIFSSGRERVNVFACAAILAGFVLGLYLLLSRMEYSWNWRIAWEYRRLYLDGLYYTLAISTGAICLGYLMGLAGGIARISGNAFAKEAARLYVIFFRGTPLLIQIYHILFLPCGGHWLRQSRSNRDCRPGGVLGGIHNRDSSSRNRIHRPGSDRGGALDRPDRMADLEVCNLSTGLQTDHSARNRPVCLADQRLIPSFGNLGPGADQSIRSGKRYDLQDL